MITLKHLERRKVIDLEVEGTRECIPWNSVFAELCRTSNLPDTMRVELVSVSIDVRRSNIWASHENAGNNKMFYRFKVLEKTDQ